VENLSPAAALDLQLPPTATGVVVMSPGRSIAANQGFAQGDIIKSINGQAIRNVGELQRALVQAGGHWDMVIDRNGHRLTLSVDG
jgi:serine protease Do